MTTLMLIDAICLMPESLDNPPVGERYITAGSETVSAAVLEQLATDECDRVRRRVAENPQTPEHILIHLATDRDCDVRLSVAEHPATPPFVLEFLALDSCADVRFGMAENPDTPLHILSILAQDHNPFVAHRARKTIGWLSPNTNAMDAA